MGKDVFRLATKAKKKKKEEEKKEKKKNHVKYATIFLRRSNFETLKGNRLELMAFQWHYLKNVDEVNRRVLKT